MAESEVCADSGGLVGLKVVDPPSIVAAGTVVDNRRENQLSRGFGRRDEPCIGDGKIPCSRSRWIVSPLIVLRSQRTGNRAWWLVRW